MAFIAYPAFFSTGVARSLANKLVKLLANRLKLIGQFAVVIKPYCSTEDADVNRACGQVRVLDTGIREIDHISLGVSGR
jgi:hypothetical protein